MQLILSHTQLKVGQMQTDTKTSVMLCGSFCHVTSRLLKTSSLTPPEGTDFLVHRHVKGELVQFCMAVILDQSQRKLHGHFQPVQFCHVFFYIVANFLLAHNSCCAVKFTYRIPPTYSIPFIRTLKLFRPWAHAINVLIFFFSTIVLILIWRELLWH